MNSINITFIIGIVLILLGIRFGFKIGLTKGLSHLIALVITVISLALILVLMASIHAGKSRNTVITVILIVLLGTIYGVVKIVLKSARKASELPILHFADKVAGIIVGLLWVAIVFTVMVTLSYRGWLGSFGDMVVKDVQSNTVLSLLNSYNKLL